MAASRTIAIRLTLEEADQFRAAFKAAGAEGETALAKLKAASAATSSRVAADSEQVGSKLKLQAHEWTNLSYQLQDFVVQVGSGGGVFRPLLQQGPQAAGAVGGVGNAFKLMAQAVTPFRAVAVLAAGSLAAIVLAAESADSRIIKLRNSLVAYSTDYAALASRIDASSRKQGGALGISSSTVTSAQTAVVQAIPGLSDADVQKSVELGQKLALTIDHDIGAAIQHLGQLAKDPAAGIKDLVENGLVRLSASLVAQIDLMQRSGDRTGAFKLAVKSLNDALSGAQMTAAQKATASLTAEWERMWHSIQEGLAGPGAALTSWLASNLRQISDIREKGGFMPAAPLITPGMTGGPLAGSTPSATQFATIYGPPIAAQAAARGYNPEMAMALAALESRQGTQTAGGMNNPFNITAAPGESSTQGFDNNNKRSYNFRNFDSIGAAAQAFFDKLERQWPGVKAAGNDPDKIAAALRVGEQGGYAEGPVGLTVEQKKQAYADALRGQMRALPANSNAVALPELSVEATRYDASGRRRDADPAALTSDYQRGVAAARTSLEGQRQTLGAEIKGTEANLANARANDDQAAVELLTAKLRDQKAALVNLRSPVEEYNKGLADQANAAKFAEGATGEVGKALADLDRISRDSGFAATEEQKAAAVAATLGRLSVEYKKTGTEIERTIKTSLDVAHGWDVSNEAGRQAEAQQRAYADAIKVGEVGSPAFLAALKLRTAAYLDVANAARTSSAAQKLAQDRDATETLTLQNRLAQNGTGADETSRQLAALKARQGLEGVTDPKTREAVMSSAAGLEDLRLKNQAIMANTTELANFASGAFDRIGQDITSAFTQGTTAAEAFSNIGKAVISELIQEMLKLSLINPLKNAFLGQNSQLPTAGGVLQSLLGGASGAASGLGGASEIIKVASVLHSGGIVGEEMPGYRALPVGTWRNAPKYHSGGLAGDEVPAVLRSGEGVFTKGQMKAMGGAGGSGAAIQADFHYHAASGGDGRMPSNDELERASKTWSREQERNILAIMARERGRPGGILWR